ncbi:hypothetical protein BOW51_05720 [Solemya velesiana gill symbiont]|uniref:Damage-control phosphatase ARMT1-like metal-binding domain-containing protein n=1 Tax=Solemya velesiana gill symbiont TaxID=1918948 RepID=A0A1T2KVF0_9GAMM|nr:ARMT1-like domain-containing protein [Solemya velesiana gill symbiont]OOZ36706.1 hypothetical protein BOW51_05720 [Solemya velesiana gill symbiont]
MSQLIDKSDDPLDTAVRLAIAGNVIDLGVAASYDLEASIERVLQQSLAIDHLEALREALVGHAVNSATHSLPYSPRQ